MYCKFAVDKIYNLTNCIFPLERFCTEAGVDRDARRFGVRQGLPGGQYSEDTLSALCRSTTVFFFFFAISESLQCCSGSGGKAVLAVDLGSGLRVQGLHDSSTHWDSLCVCNMMCWKRIELQGALAHCSLRADRSQGRVYQIVILPSKIIPKRGHCHAQMFVIVSVYSDPG